MSTEMEMPATTIGAEVTLFDVRTAATALLALRDWLEARGVTHVAMERTGPYWKPVFYRLEDAFTCLLVNTTHIKQVRVGSPT